MPSRHANATPAVQGEFHGVGEFIEAQHRTVLQCGALPLVQRDAKNTFSF